MVNLAEDQWGRGSLFDFTGEGGILKGCCDGGGGGDGGGGDGGNGTVVVAERTADIMMIQVSIGHRNYILKI